MLQAAYLCSAENHSFFWWSNPLALDFSPFWSHSSRSLEHSLCTSKALARRNLREMTSSFLSPPVTISPLSQPRRSQEKTREGLTSQHFEYSGQMSFVFVPSALLPVRESEGARERRELPIRPNERESTTRFLARFHSILVILCSPSTLFFPPSHPSPLPSLSSLLPFECPICPPILPPLGFPSLFFHLPPPPSTPPPFFSPSLFPSRILPLSPSPPPLHVHMLTWPPQCLLAELHVGWWRNRSIDLPYSRLIYRISGRVINNCVASRTPERVTHSQVTLSREEKQQQWKMKSARVSLFFPYTPLFSPFFHPFEVAPHSNRKRQGSCCLFWK